MNTEPSGRTAAVGVTGSGFGVGVGVGVVCPSTVTLGRAGRGWSEPR